MSKVKKLIKELKAENAQRVAEKTAPTASQYTKRKLHYAEKAVAEVITRLEKIV